MLFHNLINSSEKRIARKIVMNQIGTKDTVNWFEAVRPWLEALKVKPEEMKEMNKAEWKKKVKTYMENRIDEEIKESAKEMKKLRFVEGFKRQKYIEMFSMGTVKEIMKFRLNIW